jgi:hypothetical protein
VVALVVVDVVGLVVVDAAEVEKQQPVVELEEWPE